MILLRCVCGKLFETEWDEDELRVMCDSCIQKRFNPKPKTAVVLPFRRPA